MDKFDYILNAGLYEVWLSDGNVGSTDDFKSWLNQGFNGPAGPKGVDGAVGYKGVDGKDSFEIFKSSKPSLVADETDFANKLANIFERTDANLNTNYTSEDVRGDVTTIIVPPTSIPVVPNPTNPTPNPTNTGGVIQVNPEDQNNLPKINPVYIEVWDDSPTNYVIKNLQSSVTGVGPFTFENIGGALNEPYYTTNNPFDIKPNGEVYVKSAAMLASYYKENVTQQAINSAVIYFSVKDKYGRVSSNMPRIKAGFQAFGVVVQVKSAGVIMLESSSFMFDVLEGSANGTWVGTIKGSTKSNLPLIYSLPDPGPFQINSSTGKITIANTSFLPSPTSFNRIFPTELIITSGAKTKNLEFLVEVYKDVAIHILDVAIADDGRSILRNINEEVSARPGENSDLNSRSNNGGYERMLDYATSYTITKSNAVGENLGTYDGQYFGGLPASIERIFPGNVPRNGNYQLSPYDKITKVIIYIGPNYNDATRLGWRYKPARINGQEGSDSTVNPTKELILLRPL